MRYQKGDIWELAALHSGIVVVTTNLVLKHNGDAVMGAGIAKDAATRLSALPYALGKHIERWGEKPFLFVGGTPTVICLPTKTDWKKNSDIDLIERGCKELVWLQYLLKLSGDARHIFLPRLGCGLGGLNWERQVRPVVDAHLIGDQFVLVDKS
jgi:hypothetical protein